MPETLKNTRIVEVRCPQCTHFLGGVSETTITAKNDDFKVTYRCNTCRTNVVLGVEVGKAPTVEINTEHLDTIRLEKVCTTIEGLWRIPVPSQA